MTHSLEIEYPKWFDETIYLDPNDFGPNGYAVIGPLLMFYKGVVAHSPTGVCAKEAIDLPEYAKTSLEIQELEDAAVTPDKTTERPILSFTAFPTFMDPKYRNNLSARYRIREAFDRTLVDPNSSLFRSVYIVEDKRRITASIAKSLLETKPQIIQNVELLIEQHKRNLFPLPLRYADAISDSFKWPEPLRGLIEYLDPPRRVVLLAAYDFFNDKVLQAGGGAAISTPTSVGSLTAELLHGLEQFWKEASLQIQEEVETVTGTSEDDVLTKKILGAKEVQAIIAPCLSDSPRLSLKDIREFREKYRQEFLGTAAKIFAEISVIPDANKRIKKCSELASKYLEGSWFAVVSQTALEIILNILGLVISAENVDGLQDLMYNRIGKRVPLFGNRWAYWFKDRAGYKFLKGRIKV